MGKTVARIEYVIRKQLVSVIGLIAIVALGFGPSAFAQNDQDQSLAILPSLREEIAESTAGRLDTYDLDLRFDPTTSTISGTETISIVNDFGEPVDRIPLRVYPNADYYLEGSTSIASLSVGGRPGEGGFANDDRSVYWIELEVPLPEDEKIEVKFDFETVIPTDSAGTYGIFSYDSVRGTWVLADWYPIVAGYESGTGWYVDAPTSQGDPTFSGAATYTVSLSVPRDLAVVSSGSVIEEKEASDGSAEYLIVTGPARELTLVLDDNFDVLSADTSGVTVNVYSNPDTGTGDGAALTLEYAIAALESYSDRYGPYPYRELDLVETELGGAFGVSWSGLVFLDSAQFLANTVLTQSDPSRFAFTIAHEVGHQWWGAMIGSNSNDHTFMVEGLTNYLAIVFFEDVFGQDEAMRQLEIQIVQPYRRALTNYGDGIVDLPIEAPRTGASNSSLQYGKAALGFMAMREETGDKAFYSALKSYAADFQFGTSEPPDLLRAFEAASEIELGGLWSFWFEKAETTEADIDAVLADVR